LSCYEAVLLIPLVINISNCDVVKLSNYLVSRTRLPLCSLFWTRMLSKPNNGTAFSWRTVYRQLSAIPL